MSKKVRLHGGPFVPGEVYKTRQGEDVWFLAYKPNSVDDSNPYRCVFVTMDGGIREHTTDGSYWDNWDSLCNFDIVVPVEEQPPISIDTNIDIPPEVEVVNVNGIEFRRVEVSE